MNFFSQPTNLFLLVIALVSGVLLILPMLRRGAAGPGVNTLAATQLMNQKNALVLDIREPNEFSTGRIAAARNIPLSELEKRVSELNAYKAKPVIIVCSGGARSPKAAGLLRKQGFTDVFNLNGGLAAWRQAGLPLAKG